MRAFIWGSFSLLLLSCQFFDAGSTTDNQNPHLSQEEALLRSQNISQLQYALSIDISQEDAFWGKTRLDFNLKNPADLRLDFVGGQIESLSVNGEKLSEHGYNNTFLLLPEGLLKKGRNTVRIQYSHPYSLGGRGLYRFKDPSDGKAYLYSNLSSFGANKMFPCFDQPDLKAPIQLEVLAPIGWQVVSAEVEASQGQRGNLMRWVFPQSKPLFVDHFSLHAGDFHVWEGEWKDGESVKPLRLFARKKVAEFVDWENWLSWTKKGLEYYQEEFSLAYPFSKFDQVIVPDMNESSAENTAALLINENEFIFRQEKTPSQKRLFQETLLKGLGGMWFGHFVTMT
ncbi:MAG: M1 family aminopeptidase, partial [Pseudomonadota bacterium]